MHAALSSSSYGAASFNGKLALVRMTCVLVSGLYRMIVFADHESKSTAPAAGQPGRSSSGGTKAAGTFVSRTGLVDLFRGAGTQQKLFNGLQVRMGVATGFVETQTYGRDGIKNSPLHEMAKSKVITGHNIGSFKIVGVLVAEVR